MAEEWQSYVKSELDQIISNTCQNHESHNVDLKVAEKYQKEKLGRFFEKTLPYGLSAMNLNPVMFGNLLETKLPVKNYDDLTLSEIVDIDSQRSGNFHTVAMVGMSGAGKTATLINLVIQGTAYVIYIVCSSPGDEFNDENFENLATEVQTMEIDICSRSYNCSGETELRYRDIKLRLLVANRVDIEILARFIFLTSLLKKNPNLTPELFFREQINGGVTTIKKLVQSLRSYNVNTIKEMLRCIEETLPKPLVIAVDEAQIAEGILPTTFISIEANYRNGPLLRNRALKTEFARGFLTPLCETLSSQPATLVILGTSMTLKDADQVESAIGKGSLFMKIFNFPLFDEEDIKNMLKKNLNMSDCEYPTEELQLLCGRPGFSARIFANIDDSNRSKNKTEVLKDAIVKTKEQIETSLFEKVESLMGNQHFNEITDLLCRMVQAYKLTGSKGLTQFRSKIKIEQIDFLQQALCSMQVNHFEIYWVMNEPLVVTVVEKYLKSLKIDVEGFQYFDQRMKKKTQ